jgi:copper transport protein
VEHELRKVGTSARAVIRALVAITAWLLVVCLAGDAFAHASLVSTEPRNGSVLMQPPKRVELRFNENVAAGAVNLIDANGKLRNDAVVDAKNQSIVVTLPVDLPDGTQIVSYRVISADGHPVAGSVVFSIGEPTATKPPEASNAAIDFLIWLARIGVYLGLFAGIGGAFFANWIARDRIAGERVATRAIDFSLSAGIVCAALSLGLQGLDALGLPLTDLVGTLSPWSIALRTSLGPSLLIAMAAMAVSLVSMHGRREVLCRVLSAIAFIGSALALATSGHAVTASPQILTRPAVFLHALGVAFWLGALMPLTILVRQWRGAALPVVKRFSAIAVPMIGVLVLTGLSLAVVQLGSVAALVETRYGVILLIKLALVTLLLALAARNRFRLTPALAVDANAARPLSRSIALEDGIAVLVLAAVATWRFTPPPRSLAVAAPLLLHIHTEKAMLQMAVSPAKVGSNSLELQLMDGDGSPLHAKGVTLTLSMRARGIEDIERTGVLEKDDQWHVADVPLPVPGRWHLRVDALITDFQEFTLEDDFDVVSP